jgi:hypothetical protein
VSRRCELVHRRSRNSPFGQQSGSPSGTGRFVRSLRALRRANAPRCKRVIVMASLESEPRPVRRRTKNKRRPGSTARTSLVTRCKGDRGMGRESPPRMSLRVNTPSPLGCRATPAVTDNGTWQVTERAAKTRRARRWENGARHPWRYSRLTNRCS